MANIKSAAKKARQTEIRRVRNMHYKRTMRTMIKKVTEAVEQKDASTARTALRDAESYIDHVSSKGVVHKRTASRKVSRLARAVDQISG